MLEEGLIRLVLPYSILEPGPASISVSRLFSLFLPSTEQEHT